MEALFGKPYEFQKLLYLYLLSHSKSFPTRLAPKDYYHLLNLIATLYFCFAGGF